MDFIGFQIRTAVFRAEEKAQSAPRGRQLLAVRWPHLQWLATGSA
jgi:hypothetical protein